MESNIQLLATVNSCIQYFGATSLAAVSFDLCKGRTTPEHLNIRLQEAANSHDT